MHGEKEVHLALTPIVCHMKRETYLAFQIKSQYNQKHWAWLCTSPIKVKALLELLKPTLAGAYMGSIGPNNS